MDDLERTLINAAIGGVLMLVGLVAVIVFVVTTF